MKTFETASGKTLHEGDRVWAYDLDGGRLYGKLMLNDHPATRESYPWVIAYDDGEIFCVLDNGQVFPA